MPRFVISLRSPGPQSGLLRHVSRQHRLPVDWHHRRAAWQLRAQGGSRQNGIYNCLWKTHTVRILCFHLILRWRWTPLGWCRSLISPTMRCAVTSGTPGATSRRGTAGSHCKSLSRCFHERVHERTSRACKSSSRFSVLLQITADLTPHSILDALNLNIQRLNVPWIHQNRLVAMLSQSIGSVVVFQNIHLCYWLCVLLLLNWNDAVRLQSVTE